MCDSLYNIIDTTSIHVYRRALEAKAAVYACLSGGGGGMREEEDEGEGVGASIHG